MSLLQPIQFVLGQRYRVAAVLGATDLTEFYDVRESGSGRAHLLELVVTASAQDDRVWLECQLQQELLKSLPGNVVLRGSISGTEVGLGRYLLRDTVPGAPLSQQFAHGSQAPERVAELVESLATELDAAHALGFVHGGILPHNVFVGPQGQVRLAESGLGALRRAQPNPWAGPLGWAAPEQARGEAWTSATDVYAVALIAFQALTGRLYFRCLAGHAPPDAAALWAEMIAPPAPATGLSPSFDHAFARALQPNPAERTQTLGQFARELRGAVGPARAEVVAPGPQRALGGTLLLDTTAPPELAAALAAQAAGAPAASAPPTAVQFPALAPGAAPEARAPNAFVAQQHVAQQHVAQQHVAQQHVAQQHVAQQAAQPNYVPAAHAEAPAEPPRRSLLPWLLAGGAVVLVSTLAIAGLVFSRWQASRAELAAAEASVRAAQSATAERDALAERAAQAAGAAAPLATPSADEPAKPRAKSARIRFECAPTCDRVECDGALIIGAAAGVELSHGPHTCAFSAPGRGQRTESINVTGGEDRTVRIDFATQPGSADSPAATAPPPIAAAPAAAQPTVKPKPTSTAAPSSPQTKPTSGSGASKPKPQKCGTFINPCKK
jgi:serine/threonine-protein kinase